MQTHLEPCPCLPDPSRRRRRRRHCRSKVMVDKGKPSLQVTHSITVTNVTEKKENK